MAIICMIQSFTKQHKWEMQFPVHSTTVQGVSFTITHISSRESFCFQLGNNVIFYFILKLYRELFNNVYRQTLYVQKFNSVLLFNKVLNTHTVK